MAFSPAKSLNFVEAGAEVPQSGVLVEAVQEVERCARRMGELAGMAERLRELILGVSGATTAQPSLDQPAPGERRPLLEDLHSSMSFMRSQINRLDQELAELLKAAY